MTALADYVSRNSNGDGWQLVATGVYDRIVRETPCSTPVHIRPAALAHDVRKLYGDKPVAGFNRPAPLQAQLLHQTSFFASRWVPRADAVPVFGCSVARKVTRRSSSRSMRVTSTASASGAAAGEPPAVRDRPLILLTHGCL